MISEKRPNESQPQFEIPRRHDYAWEHEQNLVKQRELREKLRYKKYERDGTLSDFMYQLGQPVRDAGYHIYRFIDALMRYARS